VRNNNEFKRALIERSLSFSKQIFALVDKLPNKRSAWVITDQLVRSSTSIGANITEAQAASSRKDFINFLNHALKSGNETKYWLLLAQELDKKLFTEIDDLLRELDQIVKILGSSVRTLRNKQL